MLHVTYNYSKLKLAYFSSADDNFDVSFAGLSFEKLLQVDDAMVESECCGCDNFIGLFHNCETHVVRAVTTKRQHTCACIYSV